MQSFRVFIFSKISVGLEQCSLDGSIAEPALLALANEKQQQSG